MVIFSDSSVGVTAEMRKYQCTDQVVESIHSAPGYGTMYTLEGCVSSMGLPFWFLPEWLVPLGEGAEI